MDIRGKDKVGMFLLLMLGLIPFAIEASAQVTAPRIPPAVQPATPPRKASGAARSAPVVVDSRAAAPQVVTILHRLNGLKMFRLLLRSSEEIGAIARLDDAFKITDDIHTSVIAGLALDDGQTIAARLPEADVEMGPAMFPTTPFAPGPPRDPVTLAQGAAPAITGSTPGLLAGTGTLFERPDVTVVGRNGKRLIARYVGLDGVTGLSVLKLAEKDLPEILKTTDQPVDIGQRLRLFAPEPVEQAEARGAGTIYVRMGETEGRVVSITLAPSGGPARIKIRSTKLTPANIGGIAINDAGETVGIVDAVEKNEATLLPNSLVRNAARRVLERQSSVPRPWLGIRGEPIGTLPLEQMVRGGWQEQRALSLVEEHRGILLTSVVPESPAAGAALRPGDVILRVNDGDVKNAEDFSWLLEEAGPGKSVHFTVARPGKLAPEAIEIRLSEAPDSFFRGKTPAVEIEMPQVNIERTIKIPGPVSSSGKSFSGSLTASLMAGGIETIALKPIVATRFGAKGGLLVVYVQPTTVAFSAGLRSGDIIEAISGQQITSPARPDKVSNVLGATYSFSVIRNREQLVITVVPTPK
jgi:S1-C subfamily serine protease